MLTLTKEELEKYKSDKNRIGQLLVKKAILKEMEEKKYTKEEKEQLEELKLNVEIEFYLNLIAQKDIIIYDYEVLEVYKENSETLKDKNIIEIYPQLKQYIFDKKLSEEKVKLTNNLIEKYKVNDSLKKYIKE